MLLDWYQHREDGSRDPRFEPSNRKNAGDAQSLLNVAEGALEEVHTILVKNA